MPLSRSTAKNRRSAAAVWIGSTIFGMSFLPWVVDYVNRQREHHAAGRVEDRLERITQVEVIGTGDSPPERR